VQTSLCGQKVEFVIVKIGGTWTKCWAWKV